MDNQPPRSSLSAGLEWASRITSLGLGFALPLVAGHYADRQFGTKPALLVVGIILGFVVGVVQLTRIVRDASRGL